MEGGDEQPSFFSPPGDVAKVGVKSSSNRVRPEEVAAVVAVRGGGRGGA